MKNEGYWLSVEAIASLALLSLALAIPLHQERPSLNDLHLLKKEHDLLAIWVGESQTVGLEAMKEDFENAFPKKAGMVSFDQESALVGKQGKQAIAAKAVFFDSGMQKHELKITLFK